ncbi:MAG: PAS domain S-box protein [Sneathiella sp.]|nr:PAS domain S-box protein [Sneathiella sp.]
MTKDEKTELDTSRLSHALDERDEYPILSLISEPAFVIGFDGIFKESNKKWLKLLKPKENRPSTFYSLILSPRAEKLRSQLQNLENKSVEVIEAVTIKFKTGPQLLANLHCVKEGNDLIISVHKIAENTDTLWAYSTIGGSSDMLLEAIPAPVFCKDIHHNYINCNEEFSNFLGIAKKNILGKSVFEVAPSEKADIYRKADDDLLRRGGKQVYETQVLHADGSMRDVMFHKFVFPDADGNAAGLIGVMLDVSSRKKAERDLRDSEELLKAVIANSPAYIFVKDLDGKYIIAGNKFTRKVGWPDGYLIGKNDYEIFPKAVADTLTSNDRRVLEADKPLSEKETLTFKGKTITNLAVKFPLYDRQGNTTGIAGIATDISELVLTEEKLRLSSKHLEQQVKERTKELSEEIKVRQIAEQELLQVLSTSPIGVGIADMETGKISFANKRLKELLSPDSDDIINDLVQDHWVYSEQRFQYFNTVKENGYVEMLEAYIQRTSRAPFWANVFGQRISRNSQDSVVFWIYDLTQIKDAQEGIQKSEQELRRMLAASPVGVGISHQQTGIFSFVNNSLATLLSEKSENLVGESTLQLWQNPEDRVELLTEFRRHGFTKPRELELRRTNGESFWTLLSWTKLSIDGEDKIVSWVYDISQTKEAQALLEKSHEHLEINVALRTHELEQEIKDRKKIEKALRKSEAQFEAAANSASDWFWGMDENLRFNSFSDRLTEITGIDPNTMLGKTRREGAKTIQKNLIWEQHHLDLQARLPFRDFQFTTLNDDGSPLHVSISGVPVFDEQGGFRGYQGAGRNISKEKIAAETAKKLEMQLQQSQKMEAIGQLTGGVAHDFNNILAIILGNIDLMEDELSDAHTLRPFINAIERSANKGAQLTQRLLAYSRKQSLHPEISYLDKLADEMLDLIDRLLGVTITIHTNHDPNLQPVFADQGQIENTLINLCINSSDAMPEGGDLFIETGNVVITGDNIDQYPDLEEGNYSWLSVRDTGFGMDATTLEHVFEPFFTTKDVGKGTGLGLSMVFGFVKQSHGSVLITSEQGIGTIATIILPSGKPA